MGKEENKYTRELIEYYLKLGVEKFIFADNNNANTEKLSDVIQDYISKGIVDIYEIHYIIIWAKLKYIYKYN